MGKGVESGLSQWVEGMWEAGALLSRNRRELAKRSFLRAVGSLESLH